MHFRWNPWNLEHIEEHGIAPGDAEFVVERARRPFPEMIGDEKRYVAGQTSRGAFIQVIYILDEDDTVYVIHARPLNDSEKRRYRKRIK